MRSVMTHTTPAFAYETPAPPSYKLPHTPLSRGVTASVQHTPQPKWALRSADREGCLDGRGCAACGTCRACCVSVVVSVRFGTFRWHAHRECSLRLNATGIRCCDIVWCHSDRREESGSAGRMRSCCLARGARRARGVFFTWGRLASRASCANWSRSATIARASLCGSTW